MRRIASVSVKAPPAQNESQARVTASSRVQPNISNMPWFTSRMAPVAALCTKMASCVALKISRQLRSLARNASSARRRKVRSATSRKARRTAGPKRARRYLIT
jgi:hypothetical protein